MDKQQASALRTFGRLSESDQDDVSWMANSILAIWPRPELSGDAKLFFIDDIAFIFQKFGKTVLQESIDHFRQHQETHSRPTVRALRDRCAEKRGSTKVPISAEMQEYYYGLQHHPEDYMPIAFTVRDVMERIRRKQAGNTMTKEEKDQQTEDSWREWRQIVREGRHKEVQQISLAEAMSK